MANLNARLTFTLPNSDFPLYTMPVEFDVERAKTEGYSTGFFTLDGAEIGLEIHPEDNA